MKFRLALLSLFLSSSICRAQFIVEGVVLGTDDGLPLPQVIVKVKGTDIITKTNNDGEFTIQLQQIDQELELRYLGYRSKTIKPKIDKLNEIKLRPDCGGGRFVSPHLRLSAIYEFAHRRPGVKVVFDIPNSINRFRAGLSKVFINQASTISQFNLEIVDLGDYCIARFTPNFRYERWNILEKMNLSTSIVSVNSNLLGKSKIDIGYGIGRDFANEKEIFNIYELAYTLPIWLRFHRDREWPTSIAVPLKFKVAYNRLFWDYQLSSILYIAKTQLEVGYRHFNGVSLLTLSAGFRINFNKSGIIIN